MRKLILIMWLATSGCGATDHLAWYKKLQYEMSFENRMKENKAFSLGNAREALRQAIQDRKDQEKAERHQAKIDKIYEKVKNEKSN